MASVKKILSADAVLSLLAQSIGGSERAVHEDASFTGSWMRMQPTGRRYRQQRGDSQLRVGQVINHRLSVFSDKSIIQWSRRYARELYCLLVWISRYPSDAYDRADQH